MDFVQAIKSCFANYATFSGRAPRSEFWFFQLFCTIVGIISAILDKTVLQDYSLGQTHQGVLGLIQNIVLFIPSLAVAIRRLHDVNRSGWWLWISITIIGLLFPLFYWNCCKGTDGSNRFGADPLAGQEA